MAIGFKVLPDHNLVYVRYEGLAVLNETITALTAYMAHPDYHPDQKHFVDLERMTGYDEDYVTLLKLQAHKAEVLATGSAQTMIVYFAPNEASQKLAHLTTRSWDGTPYVVPVVQTNEADALSFLGVRAKTVKELLATAESPELEIPSAGKNA